MIKQLHSGLPPQDAKERFKQVLEGTSPLQIAKIEQELIEEGIPREEIQRLCEVHLEVFKDRLENQKVEVDEHNPINVLMEEHKIILQLLGKLNDAVDGVPKEIDESKADAGMKDLEEIVMSLLDAEKHYLREENVLFPILEKHGITEPPAIMWTEHNKIRSAKERLKGLMEKCDFSNKDFRKQLGDHAKSLTNLLSSHISKENGILFQTALRVVTQEEWAKAAMEFDEIGYCSFTPKDAVSKLSKKVDEKREIETAREGLLRFETGELSKDEAEAILNALPIDITFVDDKDVVRYFNKSEGRIFVRTKSVIGRKVQQCHPQKSVHIVERILDGFRSGKRDVAEFWIRMEGRLVHIRYFAVRGKEGKYLGTLEVTQDVTEIKRLEGERRLLDWEG
ncbi:MAG: DUF438 domain-containing protein [Thermoproteota archaeon]